MLYIYACVSSHHACCTLYLDSNIITPRNIINIIYIDYPLFNYLFMLKVSASSYPRRCETGWPPSFSRRIHADVAEQSPGSRPRDERLGALQSQAMVVYFQGRPSPPGLGSLWRSSLCRNLWHNEFLCRCCLLSSHVCRREARTWNVSCIWFVRDYNITTERFFTP